jgi:BASS family bile acid:Na+ symporter
VLDHYAQYEHAIASLQLFLAMLGMGCLLSTQDFLSQFQQPKSLCVGLALQWAGLPLIALLFGSLPQVPAGMAAGFILVACVPTGVTGNVLTWLGRGNIVLSVSLTAFTTVFALVYVPVVMHLLLTPYLPEGFQFPFPQLIRDIVINLAIPLMAGMWLRTRWQASRAKSFAHWMIRLSLLLIVVMAIGAGHSGRLNPKVYGMMGIVWLSLFCLAVVFLAGVASVVARLPAADRLALLVKSNYRNISLAIAIKTVLFPVQLHVLDPMGDAAFFTILLYGGISLVTSALVMVSHRLAFSSKFRIESL